jgi:hypothetical protein
MIYLTYAIIIRYQQSRFISTTRIDHCLTKVVLELGKSHLSEAESDYA